ncbi:MAG: NAD(+)/NADH kinase [Dehalococcoidales bacterium]|nr:NAD(+)/NADH kinase [Dehalococcoidales bacterium]
MSKIVFLYNPRLPDAEPFAHDLAGHLSPLGLDIPIVSVWEEAAAREMVSGAMFAVTLGGDGTVLRATRIVAPLDVPVVGVNLGKLGFLTEMDRGEAARKLPEFVAEHFWVEERVMLSIEIERQAHPAQGDWVAPRAAVEHLFAVNDIVAGRAGLARAVDISIWIDGIFVSRYTADGVIVATPTGSTAYSLAAGGPVLHPQLENLLLTPILPHLSNAYPLICPPGASIQLEVCTGHQAGVTVDGQIDMPLYNGDMVKAFAAPQKARFLRAQSPSYFYFSLAKRLRRDLRVDSCELAEGNCDNSRRNAAQVLAKAAGPSKGRARSKSR